MSNESRRKLLKSIATGSGAIIAGKSLPDKWVRPAVDSVILPAHAQTSSTTLYAIGDTGPCGGIVFYVTNGGLNGLEAAPSDQSAAAAWGCPSTLIGATGTAIGDGAANTAAIVAGCGPGTAAVFASAYTGGGCTGWFLPSLDELNALYSQRAVVGGLGNGSYWSSSEDVANRAWYQFFLSGVQSADFKFNTFRVRAVRGF